MIDCNEAKGPQGHGTDLAQELETVLGDQKLISISQVALTDNRVLTTIAYEERIEITKAEADAISAKLFAMNERLKASVTKFEEVSK